MFAYVYFVVDKQLAKVPAGYIKRFEKNFDPEKVYRVFWNRQIHALQNENDESCMARLRGLQEPPPKVSWKSAEGDAYYSAFILRVEESLESLIESLKKKRPPLPTTQCEDDFSTTTEDEAAALKLEKKIRKQQEAEMKKQEQAGKRIRAEEIFKTAKRTRKDKFRGLEVSDSENEMNIEEIPKSIYMELKASYDVLEREKEELKERYNKLKKSYSELEEAHHNQINKENTEMAELRELNRRLQEKLLQLPTVQGKYAGVGPGNLTENSSDSETIEVELGAGISIDRKIYRSLYELDHIRKFTKSLAVSVWGTAVLAGRSVKGRPCRNRNGPKKVIPGSTVEVVPSRPKPPLTPEKLAVISGEMRKYMMERGKDVTEVEKELKNRNRYISDKIQDICNNTLREQNKNTSS